MLPAENAIGRPRQVDLREILNGIFDVLSEGCRWRALPHDLPPWQTVYNYFRHWQRLGVWQQIPTQLRHRVRKSLDKAELATAGTIDSQSVKTTEKKGRSTALMVASASLRTQAFYPCRSVRTTIGSGCC